MGNLIDMAGSIYGDLTAVRRVENRGAKVMWLCRCSCGAEAVVGAAKLRSGHTRSCGHRLYSRGPLLNRFLTYVKPGENGCWIWTGGTNGVGYGVFYQGKTGERGHREGTGKTYAHRWSYEYHIGPIPEGLHLDHLCRNRRCVNPYHLEPVTIRVNVLRGVSRAAVNAVKTQCPKGHPYDEANTYVSPRGIRYCRECVRRQSRERYWANPEKYREYARAHKERKAA